MDNDEKKNQLDSSLRESAALSVKLDHEKKQRELELNRSFHLNDVEMEEKIMIKKQVAELEEKLKISQGKLDSLLLENDNLAKQLKNITKLNDTLVEEMNAKDAAIARLTLDSKSLKNEITALECRTSWSKDKWVDDTILNSYFLAMEKSTERGDILFLGPSATLSIRFGTPDSCMELLKLTSYLECRFVFLSLSDCSIAGKDDAGSHWSLLFLDRGNNMAYHFDSLNSINRHIATTVAYNLGVKTPVNEMPCIQQRQSFECGIHVLANAMYIAHHYCTKDIANISFSDWISGKTPHSDFTISSVETNIPQEREQSTQIDQNNFEWKTVNKSNKFQKRMVTKTKSHSMICNNKFQALDGIISKNVSQNYSNHNQSPQSATTKKSNHGTKKNPKYKLSQQSLCSQVKSHKLTIACDSQGRDISSFLNQVGAEKFKIFNNCKPGAPLEAIFESARHSSELEAHSKSDCIVLIGGTNNVSLNSTTGAQSIPIKYKDYLSNQLDHFKNTNLILATIPYRYDRGSESKENKLVKDINDVIREVSYSRPHVQVLDLYLLQSWCHTRHGLHLNRKGKRVMSKEIIRIAEDFLHITDSVTPMNLPTDVTSCNEAPVLPAVESNVISDSTPTTDVQLNTPICIIEAVMAEEVDKYRNSPQVAFSHCISGDFDSQRQMSGGVAVTFRKKFGRPDRSDCINKHLTFQQSDNQAAVYGLVTKQKFSDKPTLLDYSCAFHELTQDFNKRKFNVLICSAMGCVRDNIPPHEFAINIVKFHRITGASVKVIVTDERATRTLRNGLEYQEFAELLRSRIASELSSRDGPATTQQDPCPKTPVTTDQREPLPGLHLAVQTPATPSSGTPSQHEHSPPPPCSSPSLRAEECDATISPSLPISPRQHFTPVASVWGEFNVNGSETSESGVISDEGGVSDDSTVDKNSSLDKELNTNDSKVIIPNIFLENMI